MGREQPKYSLALMNLDLCRVEFSFSENIRAAKKKRKREKKRNQDEQSFQGFTLTHSMILV